MAASKAHVCAELGVDLLFEDDPAVYCHVDSDVVSMMVVDLDEDELQKPAN